MSLVGSRAKQWRYCLPVLGTTKKRDVCDRAFEAILGISSTKRNTTKQLVLGGKGAKLAEKGLRMRGKADALSQHDICYSFWHRLFEDLCPRPNDHTRLFPCAKTNHTIYVDYFQPWFQNNFPQGSTCPSEPCFNKARGDPDFKDVKRRPKHYHAQCGDC